MGTVRALLAWSAGSCGAVDCCAVASAVGWAVGPAVGPLDDLCFLNRLLAWSAAGSCCAVSWVIEPALFGASCWTLHLQCNAGVVCWQLAAPYQASHRPDILAMPSSPAHNSPTFTYLLYLFATLQQCGVRVSAQINALPYCRSGGGGIQSMAHFITAISICTRLVSKC
jgi:hypothetical protein